MSAKTWPPLDEPWDPIHLGLTSDDKVSPHEQPRAWAARGEWDSIEDELTNESLPHRRLASLSTRYRAIIAFAFASVMISSWIVLSPRGDFDLYPRIRMVVETGSLAVAIVSCLWLTLRPIHRPEVSQRTQNTIWLFAMASVALLAALPAAYVATAGVQDGSGDDLFRLAKICLIASTKSAAAVMVPLMFLRRKRSAANVLTIALGSYAAGSLGLYFHCQLIHPSHLWTGHVLAVVPVLAIAVVVSKIIRR